jgi:CelD/BcsL family acetyltransferase involved in cellulose biosynthesis
MTAHGPTRHRPVFAFEGAGSAIASARRAALADRYAAEALAVEWRPLADLAAVVAEWRTLAARALEPNVFYEPAFARAAAAVFGRSAGAVLVWSRATPRRLLGFFPARIETRRYGLKLPVLVGWTHPYAPLGVPLVDRDAAEPVIAAWLGHLVADPSLPGVLVLPFLPEAGPLATLLGDILKRTQIPTAAFSRHQRALLAPTGERSHYLDAALGARKLKELRRLGRRLTERGAVLFTAATEPAAMATALDHFLAVEASGWKGRAGTAATDNEELRRFMRAAIGDLAAEGKVAIDRILLDGQAIAATIALRSGRSAWFWKIAYDETFARFSPGVMLSVAVTEALLDDSAIAQADSCATAEHPMIDHIWRERLALCDLLIAVRPQVPFSAVRQLEALRAAAIAAAKRVRDHWQR